jgi:hypothetical protein
MDHWMFNCKEVTRMVSESLDRALPFYQRMGIRIHLMMCKLCTRYRKQLLILREAIHLKSKHDEEIELPISLPSGAKERIKRLLAEK